MHSIDNVYENSCKECSFYRIRARYYVGHLVMFVFRIKLLSCVVSMVRVWNIVRFHWPKRSIEKEQTYQSFKAYIYTCILKLHTLTFYCFTYIFFKNQYQILVPTCLEDIDLTFLQRLFCCWNFRKTYFFISQVVRVT